MRQGEEGRGRRRGREAGLSLSEPHTAARRLCVPISSNLMPVRYTTPPPLDALVLRMLKRKLTRDTEWLIALTTQSFALIDDLSRDPTLSVPCLERVIPLPNIARVRDPSDEMLFAIRRPSKLQTDYIKGEFSTRGLINSLSQTGQHARCVSRD